MLKNIVRIEPREDEKGYRIIESGFEEGNFLLAAQTYIVKKGQAYLVCFEDTQKAVKAVRFESIESTIESVIKDSLIDENYAKLKTLELIRAEAKKLMEQREGQGYVLEDLTQQ